MRHREVVALSDTLSGKKVLFLVLVIVVVAEHEVALFVAMSALPRQFVLRLSGSKVSLHGRVR